MWQPFLDYQLNSPPKRLPRRAEVLKKVERGLDIIKKSYTSSYENNRDVGHNTINDGIELENNTYRHFKDVYHSLH